MMNLGVRLRLAALGFAVGLMGALIVLVTLSSQKRAEDVRTRLGQVDLESFQIADRFKDTLRHANESMRRYASANDPAAWTEFLQAADELKSWIDRQATKTSTGRELAILKRMRPVCESFVLRARDLHAQMQAADEAGASLAQYGGFTEQSRRLWDLGQDLPGRILIRVTWCWRTPVRR